MTFRSRGRATNIVIVGLFFLGILMTPVSSSEITADEVQRWEVQRLLDRDALGHHFLLKYLDVLSATDIETINASVGTIRCGNGKTEAIGTASVLYPGDVILTVSHLFYDHNYTYIKRHLNQCEFVPFDHRIEPVGLDFDTDQSRSGLIVRYADRTDFYVNNGGGPSDWAVIKLKHTIKSGLHMATDRDVNNKKKLIYVTPFGNQFDLETALRGQECGFYLHPLQEIKGRAATISTDCWGAPGQSGGPLLVKAGKQLKLVGALFGRGRYNFKGVVFIGFWNIQLNKDGEPWSELRLPDEVH